MATIVMVTSCKFNMQDVWKCANKSERHHTNCLTASDIHKTIRTKSTLFLRPILLHSEGPKFDKLFKDCDTNDDQCLHPQEAIKAPNCKRNCAWRSAWIKTFCT
jgi:hypothetical protein